MLLCQKGVSSEVENRCEYSVSLFLLELVGKLDHCYLCAEISDSHTLRLKDAPPSDLFYDF